MATEVLRATCLHGEGGSEGLVHVCSTGDGPAPVGVQDGSPLAGGGAQALGGVHIHLQEYCEHDIIIIIA